MKITLEGSTNNIKTKEEALAIGRDGGRVCYSELDFGRIKAEPNKQDLVDKLLAIKHHSPFDHPQLMFYFTQTPKIIFMILNNERVYTTSEKSARFTQMRLQGLQKELYDKWIDLFKVRIQNQYPGMSSEKTEKLAQENSRYLTSVFTPGKMLHTLSFRQLNHIMHFFEEFIVIAPDNDFNFRIKELMKEFNGIMEPWYVGELIKVDRYLNLFAKRNNFQEEFGESYSTNYRISFACLAQAHRHRTLNYQMQPLVAPIAEGTEFNYFIPPIIKNEQALVEEWLNDLEKVADDYSQGTLLDVNERGMFEDFVSKIYERLCGHAQLEIVNQTKKTLDAYLRATVLSHPHLHQELKKYTKGPRCTFPDYKCSQRCEFGSRQGIERLV